MKHIPFFLFILYLLLPACKHDMLADTPDPDPADSTHTPVDSVDKSCDSITIDQPGPALQGYVSAVKTCKDWLAAGTITLSGNGGSNMLIKANTYYPYFTGQDTFWLLSQGLLFIAPKYIGVYPIKRQVTDPANQATCSYGLYDDDTVLVFYKNDILSTEDFIEISSIDSIENRIKGKFRVSMVIDTLDTYHIYYPYMVHFLDGEFDIKIE